MLFRTSRMITRRTCDATYTGIRCLGGSSTRAMSTNANFSSVDAHLHYEELMFPTQKEGSSGDPVCTAVILHGLLGSGRNWRSFARALGNAVGGQGLESSSWRLLLVDQRNHGKSTLRKHDGPHTIQSSAEDLNILLGGRPPEVLVGHSMGGKVALEYMKMMHGRGLELPKRTWVLDSMPGTVSGDPHTARQTIETLKSLPQPVPSRLWLSEYMTKKGFPKLVIDWVGTNLVDIPGAQPGAGPLVWAFNIAGCEEMYNSYAGNCMWEVLEDPPKGARIDLVRAGKCIPWPEEIEARLKRLGTSQVNVGIHTLENSGHWVQMDNPSGLMKMLAPSFTDVLATVDDSSSSDDD